MDWSELGKSVQETMKVELFDVGETTLTIGTMVVFVLVLVTTLLLSRLSRRGMDRWLRRNPVYTGASNQIPQRLVQMLVLLGGFVASMQVIGIDLSTMLAAGAVFAVGIGLALQNVAQNFVSGVILVAERTIKPGDVLLVEERVVKVVRMGVRAAILRTRDEEELIVPNSTLAQGTVINYTLDDKRFLLRGEVGVVYGSDLKLVMEVLGRTAAEIPWRLEDYEPRILLTEFGSSAVRFAVHVWTDDPWMSRQLRSDLNQRIWWSLKEAGITIAFPQLDVHFDQPVERSLELVAKGAV